jgi:hypothetical protein
MVTIYVVQILVENRRETGNWLGTGEIWRMMYERDRESFLSPPSPLVYWMAGGENEFFITSKPLWWSECFSECYGSG